MTSLSLDGSTESDTQAVSQAYDFDLDATEHVKSQERSKEMTLLTCYRYQRPWDKWQGFRNMGLIPPLLRGTPDLNFAKMLGSGGGRGFDLWPDWGRYLSLTVWSDREAALAFQSTEDPHPGVQRIRHHCSREWSLLLKPYKAHGHWDSQQPFHVSNRSERLTNAEASVVVLTRARIKLAQIIRFWRDVPHVSRSLVDVEGCRFAVGVGELPLIQQATISVWDSEEAMKRYAYRSAHHREIVKKTRAVKWYSEELFARFHVTEAWGDLPSSLERLNFASPLPSSDLTR